MATILLIDDHPDVRDVMSRLLQSYGHQVDVCDDAEMAMELLAGQMPDVVVVDDRLPGMSGMDFLFATRRNQRTSALPVILMSADPARSKEAVQAGAADFWLKGASELMDRMAHLTDRIGGTKP